MGTKNTPLFHNFFFAVAIIVMVYAGEQVKVHGIYSMRLAALCAAIAICCMGISFIPASWSESYSDKRKVESNSLVGLYQYKEIQLNNINRETVLKIQRHATLEGYYGARQDAWHKIAYTLTILSLMFTLIASILFGIGVFAL